MKKLFRFYLFLLLPLFSYQHALGQCADGDKVEFTITSITFPNEGDGVGSNAEWSVTIGGSSYYFSVSESGGTLTLAQLQAALDGGACSGTFPGVFNGTAGIGLAVEIHEDDGFASECNLDNGDDNAITGTLNVGAGDTTPGSGSDEIGTGSGEGTVTINYDYTCTPPPMADIAPDATTVVCPTAAENPGDPVMFDGSGSSASGTIASYIWDFGDGTTMTTTTATTTHTYGTPGVYVASLVVEDNGGCQSTNAATTAVIASPAPDFTGTSTTINIDCGESADLMGVVQSQQVIQELPTVIIDPIALPDGNGTAFEVPLDYTGVFPAGATVDATCIPTFCVNLEHSWKNDLTIDLVSPNGTVVRVMSRNGSNLDFGNCVNGTDNLVPGCTAEYCFADAGPDITSVTLINPPDGANGTSCAYTGTCEGSNSYVPSGTYGTENSFNAFAGDDLNGVWTIVVTDNASSDDGSIDGASLDFPLSCYAPLIADNPDITTTSWAAVGTAPTPPAGTTSSTPYTDTDPLCANSTPADGCDGNTATNNITVGPFNTNGTFDYTFAATDANGCEYEQTVQVVVADNCSTCPVATLSTAPADVCHTGTTDVCYTFDADAEGVMMTVNGVSATCTGCGTGPLCVTLTADNTSCAAEDVDALVTMLCPAPDNTTNVMTSDATLITLDGSATATAGTFSEYPDANAFTVNETQGTCGTAASVEILPADTDLAPCFTMTGTVPTDPGCSAADDVQDLTYNFDPGFAVDCNVVFSNTIPASCAGGVAPIPSLTCPTTLDKCSRDPYNCMFQDLNPDTEAVTEPNPIIGGPDAGVVSSAGIIDPQALAAGTYTFTLTYTVPATGCTATTSCTFTVAEAPKGANAGSLNGN